MSLILVVPSRVSRLRQAGFTLVELMISVALGLIVVLAAVGFVVAVAKANSENIQVTRLTQELRAITEVVGREVRRARYVTDPVGLISSGGAVNSDAIYLDGSTANVQGNCIMLSYDEPPDPPSVGGTVRRRIGLLNGNIVLDPGTDPADTNCDAGNPLNSGQVRITTLQFTRPAPGSSQIEILIAGELRVPANAGTTGATRGIRKIVHVRSGKVN